MEKYGKKLYCFNYKYISPVGKDEKDVAIVRADDLITAMKRLEHFIDWLGYAEYRGRKFLYITRITGEQDGEFPFEIGENDIVKTIRNGRLN